MPAASACSLPTPRRPGHAGGEDGGLFNWSPRSADGDTLCPCLVVPESMEFVFAVREVLTVLRQEPLGKLYIGSALYIVALWGLDGHDEVAFEAIPLAFRVKSRWF